MRPICALFCLWLVSFGVARAGFGTAWETILHEPGAVEVVNMKQVPLVEGKEATAWLRVPEQLSGKARVFIEEGKTGGIADFVVTKSGWVLVACDYSYQGNASGDWGKERWQEKDFKKNGWRLVTKTELGGVLVLPSNHEQVVFAKFMTKGETARLRCNKYHPPNFILLGSK